GSLAPQGGFPHVLLAGGAAALERLVPGLTEDLFAHGAVNPRSMDLRSHWWAAGVVRHDVPDLGVAVPMASRGLVEQRLRAAVVALPNVSTRYGVVVRGLRLTAGQV